MKLEHIQKSLNDLRAMKKQEFSSHDFIQRFAANAEHEYIEMLWKKRHSEHPFQVIHSKITLELEKWQKDMGFEKSIKDESVNIFGNKDIVQYWKFV